jgi:cell pole-organizing protein PopZ
MSAVNASITSASLDAERRSHEPSMEEILASIRRIIADDEALPVVRRERDKGEPRLVAEPSFDREAAPRSSEATGPGGGEEPKDRAPTVVRPVGLPAPEPAAAASTPSLRLQSQDSWLRSAPEAEPQGEVEPASDEGDWTADVAAKEADDGLDDSEGDEADARDVSGSAATEEQDSEAAGPPLVSPAAAASVASHFQALAASMVINEADVIERYARDILRPMLKQWLDDNLPALVERLVRAEIERVARGKRSAESR